MPREMNELKISPERMERIAHAPMPMRPEALRALAARIVAMEDFDEPPEIQMVIVEQAPSAIEAKVPRLGKVNGAVALVFVYGAIGQHPNGDYWAWTFSERVVDQISEAVSMPNVGAVVLVFDSPGGIVYGIPEAAQSIRELAQVKPIYGWVKAEAASAAYWLASSTTKLFAQPSAEVGSIGVWMMHIDASKAFEEYGWKVTLISAGKFKVEGNPFEPLSDEARGHFQSGVDRYYDDFLEGVAIGRGVSKGTVKNDFGEGRMFGAEQAKAVGMIDGIATLDELLAGIMKPSEASGSKRSRASAIAIAEAWSPTVDA
jgi:signal peptide peptidase SppA